MLLFRAFLGGRTPVKSINTKKGAFFPPFTGVIVKRPVKSSIPSSEKQVWRAAYVKPKPSLLGDLGLVRDPAVCVVDPQAGGSAPQTTKKKSTS